LIEIPSPCAKYEAFEILVTFWSVGSTWLSQEEDFSYK
jgi:hypothetical protein